MQKFGLQRDSMGNMVCFAHFPQFSGYFNNNNNNLTLQFDLTLHLLDSRASRMGPNHYLITLRAGCIGRRHANHRKWYFAVQLNLDDAVGQSQSPGLQHLKTAKGSRKPAGSKSLGSARSRWRNAANNMGQYGRLRQIALYLLCWGEAGSVRFVPETLCFIFKCAGNYCRSPECRNRVEPAPGGLCLNTAIKPLCRSMRDHGYAAIDIKFVKKVKDHAEIIGDGGANQLFWYPEGLFSRIMCAETYCLPTNFIEYA
jgi:1,3-beta-glucan synthase